MAAPNVINLNEVPATLYDGGSVRGISETNFPILTGQDGSMYIVNLVPGGVREPHWHPSAWEFDYCLSGTGQMMVLDPNPAGTNYTFPVAPGDAIFVPQGYFHYFENTSPDEDFNLLVVFNSSTSEPDDSIGIVASMSTSPDDVLGAVFGVSPSVFKQLPVTTQAVVIAKKPSP